MSFFVCLSSLGAELRSCMCVRSVSFMIVGHDCVVLELLVLCGRCTGGHGVFKFSVDNAQVLLGWSC